MSVAVWSPKVLAAPTLAWFGKAAAVLRGSPGWSRISAIICKELAAAGTKDVVVVPIGFISDHMEVLFDLDYEAAHIAQAVGLNHGALRNRGHAS